MNIFLSYASAQRALAEDLCHRLQVAGHEVFFDREDLPPGRSYDDHIFQAIAACELFVFLVTPDSVADGRYTRTELKIAARRWPTPDAHVLPVLAAPTPIDTVPSYLRALNLLQPEGNLAAEVLLEVQARRQTQPDVSPTAPSDAGTTAAGPPDYGAMRLRFRREAEGRYRLQIDAPVAAAATHAYVSDGEPSSSALLAIDLAAFERGLWQGAMAIEGTARRGRRPDDPPSLLPGAAGVRETGAALHALLFGSTLGGALRERLRAVDPQRGRGLRVVVDTTDAPELARLPWEVLYSQRDEDFVFSDRFKPLVRRLEVNAPPPALAVAPPLRLLVAVASPADRPELQVGEELGQLDASLASLVAEGRLQAERLDHTTLERLDDALLRWRPHMLHFIGHGDFDGDEGRLLLESTAPGGTSAPISGHRLAVLLRNHLASLRLVFLNSCLGAAAAPHAAFGGVAQSLVRRGMPAVVAMQFPVPDTQAVGLARHFYRYVAAGQPVDAALTSARTFLYARGDEVCWAAPVLYLNAEDGRLFDIEAPAGDTLSPSVVGSGSGPGPGVESPLDNTEFDALLQKSFGAGGDDADDGAKPVISPSKDSLQTAVSADPFETGPSPLPDGPPPPAAMASPSGAEPAAARRHMRVTWVMVIAVLLGAAAWILMRGGPTVPAPGTTETTAPPRDGGVTSPGPQPSIPVRPEPLPPAPPAQATTPSVSPAMRATSRAAVDRAFEQLLAGERIAAASTLEGLRRDDPEALSPDLLAEAHAPLTDVLLRAAEASLARGERDVAAALMVTLQAMVPLSPDQQRRLAALQGQVFPTTAAGAPYGPAFPNALPGPHGGLVLQVRRGDTLWGLAQRFLGAGDRWPALVTSHNAMADAAGVPRIETPDRLVIGQWLLLPPDPATGRARAAYHVAPGDSLWRIARRIYGDGARWPHLQAVNGLSDPDQLVPSQVLEVTPLE